MGKILLIEDDGTLTRDLRDELSVSHEVTSAYSYASAIGLWKKYKGQFDCIILDLNINPNGLEDEDIAKYFPIHGILILNEICFRKVETKKLEIWKKTVIHSAYISSLQEKSFEFKYYNHLKLVPKTKTSISKLLAKVEEIVKIYTPGYGQ